MAGGFLRAIAECGKKSYGKEEKISFTHHAPYAQGKKHDGECFCIANHKNRTCRAESVYGERPQGHAVAALIAGEGAYRRCRGHANSSYL